MMTPAQIGQQFKQKYPGVYDAYPDEVIGQRALVKNPSLGDSSLGDIAGQAGREAMATVGSPEPGSTVDDLATNPVTQAKILPAVAGTGLAAMGVPMGASLGTGMGNLIADAALKSYGRSDQIPSTKSQVLGTGAAAIGDLTAIPAINKSRFGSQVGAAEIAAKVPPVQDIPSTPMSLGQKTVGEFINDGIKSLGSDAPKDYTFWRQLKDQVDRIYELGKTNAITTLDKGRLSFLSNAAQNGINSVVPGRAAPAASLAMSQTVPNAIANTMPTVPYWLKQGLATGGGLALEKALSGVGSR